MPSLLGHKGDDLLVSVKRTLDAITAEMGKDGCHNLLQTMTAGASSGLLQNFKPAIQTMAADASSGVLGTLKPTLQVAQNWAMFGAAASGIVALTTTLVGADAVSQFKKLAIEMSQSLKGLCEAAQVSTNLAHEDKFPKLVYDFVADKIATVAGGDDLEAINDASLARRLQLLQTPSVLPDPSEEQEQDPKRAHYFFVYHPGTAWHSSFNNLVRTKPLPGFIGATDNLTALGLYFNDFRALIGPEAVIHLLLPSAHMYVIEDDIIVAAKIQPLKVTGQKHYTGEPYVHAPIMGLEEKWIQDVGMLIKPNEVSAGQMTGAVAGGLGAGIAGTVAGFFVIGVIAATGCAIAGPVFLAGAAAEMIVGGGMVVGALGGGSTAGALTGVAITEKFKWKGKGRDRKAKQGRK